MSGIICCDCSKLLIAVLQCALIQWRNDLNTIRWRTSHSKISTNDEPYCKGAVERIILDFIKAGEETFRKSRSMEISCWSIWLLSWTLFESFSSASYSKWDDNHAWSSQEWKTDTEMCERSGRPDVTSWRATRESQPGFSHKETQHDGTAQSVVNEVIPRERSARLDVDPLREERHNNLTLETMKHH